MIQATVEEAQQRLPDLLGAVEAGEEVEIRGERADLSARRDPAPAAGYGSLERCSRCRPLIDRSPRPGPGRRYRVPKAGRLKGRLVVPDDFDEPLEGLREYIE